jgi:hypothetical protein
MEWPVGGAGSGERTVEAAAAAGVGGRKTVARRCRRCCGDIAAAAAVAERVAQMHLGSGLIVRGIGGDEDGCGAGGRTAVSWPSDWRVPLWNPWKVVRSLGVPFWMNLEGNEAWTLCLGRTGTGEEGKGQMVEGTGDESPLVWFEVYTTKPGKRPLRSVIFRIDFFIFYFQKLSRGEGEKRREEKQKGSQGNEDVCVW